MKPTKAYTNLVKARVNMALKRRIIGNYPAFAVMDTASFCQLRCPACPTGLRSGIRASAKMSWQTYKSVIDEVGDYLFRLDLCNWGEPFLNEQTPEFVHYAESKGIRVIVHSNLSMRLSDDYVHRIVRSGLGRLVVSADGATQETYSIYRRGGNLSLVRENMLRIQQAKRQLGSSTPKVFWKFLVFEHNEHEMELARSSYGEWGADEILFAQPWMPKVQPYDHEFRPSKATQEVLRRQMENPKCAVQPRATPTCPWLYLGLVLNPNGTVSPCCGSEAEEDDFAEYSVDESFFHSWNSAMFERARGFLARTSHKKIPRFLDMEMIEVRQTICERCPVGWWEGIATMPEWQIVEVIISDLKVLLKKRHPVSLLSVPLVVMAGGTPLWRELSSRVVNRLKRRGT